MKKKPAKEKKTEDIGMMSLSNFAEAEVAEKLKKADINTMSPLEALNLIFELKKILSES